MNDNSGVAFIANHLAGGGGGGLLDLESVIFARLAAAAPFPVFDHVRVVVDVLTLVVQAAVLLTPAPEASRHPPASNASERRRSKRVHCNPSLHEDLPC